MSLISFNHGKDLGPTKLSVSIAFDIADGIVSHEEHSLERLVVHSNRCGSGTPNEAFLKFLKKHMLLLWHCLEAIS